MSPRAKKAPAPKPRRSKGEGNIKQRKDGLWVGSFAAGVDPVTGKPKRHYVSAKDKDTFDRKWSDARSAFFNNRPIEGTNSMTFAQWATFWLENVTAVRPNTLRQRRIQVAKLVKIIGERKMADLDRADVELVLSTLMKPKPRGFGLSPSTVGTYSAVLQTVIEDCIGYYSGKVLSFNPAKGVKRPVADDDDFDVLSPEEALRVIDHTWDQRNGSRIAMALLTGARQGEVLGLTWDRVDFDGGEIIIDRQLQSLTFEHGCQADGVVTCGNRLTVRCPKRHIPINPKIKYKPQHLEGTLFLVPTKTGSSERHIPLVEPLRSILLMHRDRQAASGEPNPHNLVWTRETRQVGGGTKQKALLYKGQPLSPSRDSAAWNRTMEEAGVPVIHLHDARHTAITLLYELGVPEIAIKDIAGHADERITEKYRKKGRLSKVSAQWMQKLGDQLTPAGRRPEDVVDADVIEGDFTQSAIAA
jgi:integrase